MTTELTLLSRVAYRGQEVTGPRLRGLLALLAGDLRAGSSTARLVAGLWPEAQPENPTKAVQVLVSRARSQLGGDVIASTPTGYRLALTEEQVDTCAVRLSAAAGLQESRAGDHAAALAHAEAGLALWEGAPVADPVAEDPVAELRGELVATYRSLVRTRAVALARLGRSAEAVELLTDLVVEHPRDEELLLELLRCEATTAGRAAALARYDAYRRALRDDLGADPGGALQALYLQLLRDEAPAVRHGVPHDPNPLLGRDEDIPAVLDLLGRSRVTSIVGPGGLGKTRLAHAVGREAEQRVVHFVPLAGVRTDDEVVGEVAGALGVGDLRQPISPLAIPTDVLVGIINALGPGSTLLVLDNCEQVVAGVAELVQALVSMTRDLRILTTSRAPLGLSSESVYLLPGLTLPTAVELFDQRARSARPGVDLPPSVVAELCDHLDGLPLAVELAAARVRVMSVADIAGRLQDRFSLLRGGPRDAPERHRTLLAVVDWSWNLLPPASQAAMRALSVFPGGFTADGAEHLLGDSDALHLVEQLVDQSLLTVADTPAGTRFRMLETVREFSAVQREAVGDSDRITDDFLAWARDFGIAHHESPLGSDLYAGCARIRAEQDNLVQALRLGMARSDGEVVAATSAVLGALWMAEANYTRLMTLQETDWLLSHYRPGPELVEVTRTAVTLGLICSYIFQGFRPVRFLVAVRRLPSAVPTTLMKASATVLAATPEMVGPEPKVLRDFCDSPEPLVAGVANGIATYLWERRSDLDSALKAARRTLKAFEAAGNPLMEGMAHARIGEMCMQLEEGAEAVPHLEVALRVHEQLSARSDAVQEFRLGLVLVNLQIGALAEAERRLTTAVTDDPVEAGATHVFALGVQAEISLARGDVEAGLRLWRQAVQGTKDADSPVPGTDPALDPWTLEVSAVAVVAHGYHGRSELVADLAAELPHRLTAMLTNPRTQPPAYLMEQAICGSLLLALAAVDLDRGARTGDRRATRTGARLVHLAERFRFLRNFHPTMASTRARATAEQADRPAYDEAVSSYAGLGPAELRAAALELLSERAG